jgi:hypothetical protein
MGGALRLLRSQMEGGNGRDILAGYRSEYVAIANALPKDAVILFHNNHTTLGFDRPLYFDWLGFQGEIDYRQFKTPRDVWERFHQLGITHVIWVPGQRPLATKQEEILWNVFAETLTDRRQFGGYTMAPLPKVPPPVEAPYQVLVVGVPGLPDGLYPIESLSNSELLPPAMRFQAKPAKTAPSPGALLADAKAVLMGGAASLDAPANEQLNREFRPIPGPVGVRVFVRH